MKKIYGFMFLFLALGTTVFAENQVQLKANTVVNEGNATDGLLKVNFVRTEELEGNIVVEVEGNDSTVAPTITKDGAIHSFEVRIGANANDTIKIKPYADVNKDGIKDGDQLTFDNEDLSFNVEGLKGNSQEQFLVFFENAKTTDELAYSNIHGRDSQTHYLFSAYYSPVYEETLGIHSWGLNTEFNSAGWGTPLQIIKNVGNTSQGIAIKGFIVEADGATGGFKIYAGDDASSKCSSAKFSDMDGVAKGELKMVAVANNLLYGMKEDSAKQFDDFTQEMSSFGFANFDVVDGELVGTFAKTADVIFVEFSAAVPVPFKDENGKTLTTEQRIELVISYFDIFETNDETKKLDIVDVDFALDALYGTTSYIISLSEDTLINNEEAYTIEFNQESNGLTATSDLNIDREGPEISLVGNKDVIEVKHGEKFDRSLFPQYRANDNRDGDVTVSVYVPQGKGYLNTNVKGDYEITLAVKDSWGNVSTKTFIFRVK